MKINNSKKTKEVSIAYEDNGSINVNIFNNEILKGNAASELVASVLMLR